MKLLQNFYSHSTNIDRLNYSFITLIPKKTGDCSVKDFRPISLINGATKIISKTLSKRLSRKMNLLVSSSYLAFIRERNISEYFVMAMENINFCKTEAPKGLIYKVDFEKAFDNVDWSFLLKLLSARGFSSRWCRWIENLVCTVKSSVLINGDKGIGSLSNWGRASGKEILYLLVSSFLVVDTLDRMIKSASRFNLIIEIGPSNITG